MWGLDPVSNENQHAFQLSNTKHLTPSGAEGCKLDVGVRLRCFTLDFKSGLQAYILQLSGAQNMLALREQEKVRPAFC